MDKEKLGKGFYNGTINDETLTKANALLVIKCADLERQVKKQKEVIDKSIDFIKNGEKQKEMLKMKITMYELLGLVKDGKAPKKIKYRDRIWEYVSTIGRTGYQYYSTFFEEWQTLQNQVYLEECLNDEVEILEEPKKIEKITVREKTLGFPNGEWTARNMDKAFAIKINELIDEINNLKEND